MSTRFIFETPELNLPALPAHSTLLLTEPIKSRCFWEKTAMHQHSKPRLSLTDLITAGRNVPHPSARRIPHLLGKHNAATSDSLRALKARRSCKDKQGFDEALTLIK